MSSIIDSVRDNVIGADWRHLLPHRARGEGPVNVGSTERWISAAVGAAFVVAGLRRRRWRGWLLPMGGGLILRALTGRSGVNRALGRNSARREQVASPVASVAGGEGIKVERRVVIDRPPDEVYRFWRNLENLPRFMEHLESVTMRGGGRSHWVAKAPGGTRVEWDAEIHNEIPGELIAWRSLPGADVPNAGSVHFTPALGGRGTEVRVVLSYEPPAGRLGAAVATLFGEEPEQQVEDDLRRLKQVLESADFSRAGA
ncbi:MAG TPA: SRPBCC family protein [Gemmatimonadales bacterium]|nr:SRPBCC family protein [Gemmatimonadales bacterium]